MRVHQQRRLEGAALFFQASSSESAYMHAPTTDRNCCFYLQLSVVLRVVFQIQKKFQFRNSSRFRQVHAIPDLERGQAHCFYGCLITGRCLEGAFCLESQARARDSFIHARWAQYSRCLCLGFSLSRQQEHVLLQTHQSCSFVALAL